ncbi:MAG: hypothetical protein ACOH10_07805 [Rhodoglobus sp.]
MMTKVAVRKADADRVLAAVRRQFAGWLDPADEGGPQLVKDFDWGAGPAPYAVIWEGGPYDWAMLAGEGGIEEEFGAKIKAVVFPKTVFCEPYTGWALAIWPA